MALERKLVDIEPEMSEKGRKNILIGLTDIAEKPDEAIREYLTNAIDAVYASYENGSDVRGRVDVAIDSYSRRVVITDNGTGMSSSKMASLPVKIGDSAKAGKVDQRGEKGIGLLSFGGLGSTNLYLISRQQGIVNSPLSFLNYTISGEGSNRRLRVKFADRLSRLDLAGDFYDDFDHGTRAIIGVSEYVWKDFINKGSIEDLVRQLYTPILFKGEMDFTVSEWNESAGRFSMRKIEKPELEGDVLFEGSVPFSAKRAKKGSDVEEGDLEVALSFSADNNKGKVGVFTKGVRVHETLTQLDRKSFSDLPLFNCPYVHGFVNQNLLSLTLGRHGFTKDVRNSRIYRAMKRELVKLNDRLWPEVERLLVNVKEDVASERIEEVRSIIDEIYSLGNPIDTQRRRGTGVKPDKPTEPDEEIGVEDIEFIEGEDDEELGEKPERKRRGRRFGFGISRTEFDIQHKDLQARVGNDMRGDPCIEVNTGHPHYKEVFDVNKPKEQRVYLLRVVIPRIAEAEMKSARNKEITIPYDEVSTRVVDRIEELRRDSLGVKPKRRKTTRAK
jgi:hypothetical protein